jgi:2-polyprenyl-6-hydroxyphenyl methylase/3-demethylubiquinone-9 3-methyltransferase
VYDLALLRVKQYLDAEVNYVLERIHEGDLVLELGCGYGRNLPKLAGAAQWVIGIDTSLATLKLAKKDFRALSKCLLAGMDAVRLGFQEQVFDCVVCIQNGISAFHVDQRALIDESIRVTKPNGIVLFSTYSDKFWNHRLQWFELQSEAGLLGEIDYEKTKDGVIVCKDGFKATTVRCEDFLALTAHINADVRIVEVDESSLFCKILLGAGERV